MTATTAAANTASAGKVWRQCGKCRGTGRLPEYGHVAGGSCFPCAGSGEGAYGAVYVHDERDCNPVQALHMARQYAAENGITL